MIKLTDFDRSIDWTDPRQWNEGQVQLWIQWNIKQFSLEGVEPTNFRLNGLQLVSLCKESFLDLAPLFMGDILWEHLDILLKGKFKGQSPFLFYANPAMASFESKQKSKKSPLPTMPTPVSRTRAIPFKSTLRPASASRRRRQTSKVRPHRLSVSDRLPSSLLRSYPTRAAVHNRLPPIKSTKTPVEKTSTCRSTLSLRNRMETR